MTDIKKPSSVLEDEANSERSEISQPSAGKKGGILKALGVIIIIAVIALVGLYLVSKYTKYNVLNVNKTAIDKVAVSKPSGWSAVFLSNGQVYFGKIEKQNDNLLFLSSIYYLQVTKQIQPAEQNAEQQEQQNVSLVKLGNELHGPKDEMTINMDHVLFTEELKQDSRVVDAINRYLEENK